MGGESRVFLNPPPVWNPAPAYHTTRTAGFHVLPSERILHNYTHQAGFQQEVNNQLRKQPKVADLQYCGIIFDEMKIKESLVYVKYTGSVVGFELGEINNDPFAQEWKLEEDKNNAPVANYLLVLMVRGIILNSNFVLSIMEQLV